MFAITVSDSKTSNLHWMRMFFMLEIQSFQLKVLGLLRSLSKDQLNQRKSALPRLLMFQHFIQMSYYLNDLSKRTFIGIPKLDILFIMIRSSAKFQNDMDNGYLNIHHRSQIQYLPHDDRQPQNQMPKPHMKSGTVDLDTSIQKQLTNSRASLMESS